MAKGIDLNKILRAGLAGGVTLWLAPFVLSMAGVSLTITPPGFLTLFIAGAIINMVLDPTAEMLLKNVKLGR